MSAPKKTAPMSNRARSSMKFDKFDAPKPRTNEELLHKNPGKLDVPYVMDRLSQMAAMQEMQEKDKLAEREREKKREREKERENRENSRGTPYVSSHGHEHEGQNITSTTSRPLHLHNVNAAPSAGAIVDANNVSNAEGNSGKGIVNLSQLSTIGPSNNIHMGVPRPRSAKQLVRPWAAETALGDCRRWKFETKQVGAAASPGAAALEAGAISQPPTLDMGSMECNSPSRQIMRSGSEHLLPGLPMGIVQSPLQSPSQSPLNVSRGGCPDSSDRCGTAASPHTRRRRPASGVCRRSTHAAPFPMSEGSANELEHAYLQQQQSSASGGRAMVGSRGSPEVSAGAYNDGTGNCGYQSDMHSQCSSLGASPVMMMLGSLEHSADHPVNPRIHMVRSNSVLSNSSEGSGASDSSSVHNVYNVNASSSNGSNSTRLGKRLAKLTRSSLERSPLKGNLGDPSSSHTYNAYETSGGLSLPRPDSADSLCSLSSLVHKDLRMELDAMLIVNTTTTNVSSSASASMHAGCNRAHFVSPLAMANPQGPHPQGDVLEESAETDLELQEDDTGEGYPVQDAHGMVAAKDRVITEATGGGAVGDSSSIIVAGTSQDSSLLETELSANDDSLRDSLESSQGHTQDFLDGSSDTAEMAGPDGGLCFTSSPSERDSPVSSQSFRKKHRAVACIEEQNYYQQQQKQQLPSTVDYAIICKDGSRRVCRQDFSQPQQ